MRYLTKDTAMHESRSRQRRFPRLTTSVLMFLLALFLGAAGVFSARHYIEERVEFYRGQYESTDTMVSVVVPGRALKRGDMVMAGDLLVREIPEQYVDSNSVTADTYGIAVGQRMDFDIDEGRPLLWAHLDGGLSPTFSGNLTAGLRAMTVRVDEVNSISGFLQPEDKVDLLLSHGASEQQQVLPLIERLEVIATGIQTMIDKSYGATPRKFTTITVQVTPEEAQKITLAQQVGKLTAMLRHPDDESSLATSGMSVPQLLNVAQVAVTEPVAAPVKRAQAPRPAIEYIIGGKP